MPTDNIELSAEALSLSIKIEQFIDKLSKQYEHRYADALDKITPEDDDSIIEYAYALDKWHKDGKPLISFFHYGKDKRPCPIFIEFRQEISKEFGLDILTSDEAEITANIYKRVTISNPGKWNVN